MTFWKDKMTVGKTTDTLERQKSLTCYTNTQAFLAQLGERQTEDLKVAGSSPAEGIYKISYSNIQPP